MCYMKQAICSLRQLGAKYVIMYITNTVLFLMPPTCFFFSEQEFTQLVDYVIGVRCNYDIHMKDGGLCKIR